MKKEETKKTQQPNKTTSSGNQITYITLQPRYSVFSHKETAEALKKKSSEYLHARGITKS